MDDVCLIHHNLQELQHILDTTNHVANKYHIQFGAAKCKVIKRGKGKTSSLTLNGETLEEVPTYKYLGEIINNKGNLTDHIAEIERKVRGATDSIIAETGNKEFKGIKMQAIWQMVDAIIIPIMTYACEGWTAKQGRKQKTTMHIQRNNKNPTIPTQGNPHNDPPERNRQHTNRVHHQDKENPTSQAHRPNERRIPNKGCHASQSKHVEKTCNRPRQGTPYIRPNGYPEQGDTKTQHPKRNRNKNPGRNRQWSRNKD